MPAQMKEAWDRKRNSDILEDEITVIVEEIEAKQHVFLVGVATAMDEAGKIDRPVTDIRNK